VRYLTLGEVLRLHADLVATSGGATGVRDLGRVQAALAQPMATFAGDDLYPSVIEKAGALGFALIQGHAFVDGNKRIGHAAMEVFLMLNGFEVAESVDEQDFSAREK
jgi:death-on-curing protein